MKPDGTFLICDIETTGLGPTTREIITFFGLLLNNDMEVIDELDFKFRPEKWDHEAEEASIRSHGILQSETLKFPKLSPESMKELLGKIPNSTSFVCHANPNNMGQYYLFDYAFMQAAAGETDLLFEWRGKCPNQLQMSTLIMYSDLMDIGVVPYIKKLRLPEVCRQLNIPLEKHHDARSDTQATHEIFKKLRSLQGASGSVFTEYGTWRLGRWKRRRSKSDRVRPDSGFLELT